MPNPSGQATWLRLSSGVAVESKDNQHTVLYHKHTSRRIRVPATVYQLILRLQTPCTMQTLTAENPQFEKVLAGMVARGFLVDGSMPEQDPVRSLSAPAYTLFHAPRVNMESRPEPELPQVTVLGVPFDLGSIVVSGQRRGPTELRTASNEYPYTISRSTGEPRGWYDVDSERTILEGITLGDAGDFCFEYGEAQSAIYDRLGKLWMQLWQRGTFPLVLGGDHSITYPLVEELQRERELAVLWFDAHTDESYLRPGQTHHYGNVLTRILTLPNVRRVVQVGTRGFASARQVPEPEGKLCTISAGKLRRHGPEVLLDAIPAHLPCYISLDLDVLDPSVAPAVGTPVAGGLLLHELEAAVEAVALTHRIEGMDLVELNPDRAPGAATAGAACRLLLKGLDAVMCRRLRPAYLSDSLTSGTKPHPRIQ